MFSLNFNDKTPAVVDPFAQEPKGLDLVESRAVVLYVAGESGLFSPRGPAGRCRLCVGNQVDGCVTRRYLEGAVVASLRARRIVDPRAYHLWIANRDVGRRNSSFRCRHYPASSGRRGHKLSRANDCRKG